jgi:hypothetical protein
MPPVHASRSTKHPVPAEIRIPARRKPEAPWRITEPYLKLALKYGLVGPWGPPNLSVAFDAHALSRGPGKGPPTLADFWVTALMGSRPRGTQVTQLQTWLRVPRNAAKINDLAQALAVCQGLEAASPVTIKLLASVADQMIQDQKILKGIRLAKIYKWLAAWAPAHVPMFDAQVHDALTEYSPTYLLHSSTDLLERFREILLDHLDLLQKLAKRLSSDLDNLVPAPIPPVRVLDGLIWFDWGSYHQTAFSEWFLPFTGGDCYKLTKRAATIVKAQGLVI